MAFRPFITNILGLDGDVESGGLLYSYVKGTSTPLPLYSDEGVTPATNPVVADSIGQITAYFNDTLQYSWRAKTADGATTLWEANVVSGAIYLTYVNPDYTVVLAGFNAVRYVATYAALTALTETTGLLDDGVYYTRGRSAEGDGGEGLWRYDAGSSATADGGTVLTSSVAGRFIRIVSGNVIMLQWFPVNADGSTSDTTVIETAAATASTARKWLLGDPSKTYGVAGQVDLPADYTWWDSINLKQLTPTADTELKTIFSNARSNVRLFNCSIDLNSGTGTSFAGSIENYKGAYFAGGDDIDLYKFLVFNSTANGGVPCSAVHFNNCHRVSVKQSTVRDITFNLGSDPSDDRVNGWRVDDGDNISFEDCVAVRLKGNYGSGVKRRYTRGFAFAGGVTQLTVNRCRSEDVDQGFDITGSAAADGFTLDGNFAINCNSWGIKSANTARNSKIVNNTIEFAGLGHIVVSGISPSSDPIPQNILIANNQCFDRDTNSTFSANTETFYVGLLNTASTADDPRHIRVVSNTCAAREGATGMNYGLANDCPPTTTVGANIFLENRVSGYTTALYRNYAGEVACEAYLSSAQTIGDNSDTVLATNAESSDPLGMHSSGVFTCYVPGLYAFSVVVHWNNAAGDIRRVTLRKNSTDTDFKSTIEGSNLGAGQSQPLSGIIELALADTFSFRVLQDTGGNLDILGTTTRIKVWRVHGAVN